ncbi:hypothetical protein RAS1_15120 [Phycisphaerae bacterium RAS1]|nr:hypothetical protein RAS1_15120 [Phycisphaerae bacterium RAS1]
MRIAGWTANCDGLANVLDINPFNLALQARTLYEAAYPDCEYLHADVNRGREADVSDIIPFVGLLAGG